MNHQFTRTHPFYCFYRYLRYLLVDEDLDSNGDDAAPEGHILIRRAACGTASRSRRHGGVDRPSLDSPEGLTYQ